MGFENKQRWKNSHGRQFESIGDEFFKTSQGYNTLPLGTITIQETKAPKGYLLNEEIFVRQITSKGTTEGVETYNMPTSKKKSSAVISSL